MTRLSAPALIDIARKLLDAVPVDEQHLYEVLRTLIDQYGYKKTALARSLRIGKQRLFRILASQREEWMPYRAMCGDQASVIEALHGMPVGVREQLRKQFERTGKTYSQAALRRLKRQLAAGEDITIADMTTGSTITPASSRRAYFKPSCNAMMAADRDEERAWLRSLAAPLARAERELLARLCEVTPPVSIAEKQEEPPDSKRVRTPHPVIELTPGQARRLIRKLGGNADLSVKDLQGELVRLARR